MLIFSVIKRSRLDNVCEILLSYLVTHDLSGVCYCDYVDTFKFVVLTGENYREVKKQHI